MESQTVATSAKRWTAALLLVAALVSTASALAYPYTAVFVYGDSLSDNGNLYSASGGTVPSDPPYFQGRRSNGPVAVEQLAASLGTPLYDFAWIGATTGIGNYGDSGTVTSLGGLGLPGMGTELIASLPYLPPAAALADALFVVWGGPNDFLAPAPSDAPLQIAQRAVANELSIITQLQGLGAQHILVPGMPDLGLTPFFRNDPTAPVTAAQATALTDYFNLLLVSSLPGDVTFFDTSALFRTVIANPGAYGFTNSTDPCFNGSPPVCANPDQYVFFDDFHPTAATHAILAREFSAAVVPEPGTLALVSITLLGLVWSRRHQAGKPASR
jgi:phospholipase/lecithinase/hemolysin